MTAPEMRAAKRLIDQARRAQLAGRPVTQIDASLAATYRRAHRVVDPNRQSFAQRGLDRDQLRAETLRLAAAGLSIGRVAAQVGVSKSQAHKWITSAGCPGVSVAEGQPAGRKSK